MTMTTKRASILMFTLLILPCLFATVAQAADDKKAEEQQEVRKMARAPCNVFTRLSRAPKPRSVQQGMPCSVIRV